jgi:hypothetical protein
MMPAVIFPDVEKVLVAAFKSELDERDESYAINVHVATKKPPPDKKPYPKRMVIIRSDGGPKVDWVRKIERIGITIWADTYADASDLARLVEALSTTLTGEQIKLATVVLSPTRVDEAGPQECRYLTLELIVKGSTLQVSA